MKGFLVLSASLFLAAAAGTAPAAAVPAASGFESSCSADCMFTSCTISCRAGAGGGAVCTCAWGVASCGCGGGGGAGISASVRFTDYDASIFAQNATTNFRDAVPAGGGGKRTATPGIVPGRSPLPAAAPQLTLYLPDARKAENLKILQDVLAAFGSPAAARASAAAAALHSALGRRDPAAYQKAADDYQAAARALRPAEQKALSRVADLGSPCPAAAGPR